MYIHVRIESAVTTMDQKKTGRLRRVIDVRLTKLNFRLILLHSVLATDAHIETSDFNEIV